jgi:RNA ligase (TIGR02306 family)
MSEIVRKLATVERIIEITPIEGADLICAYKVRGWKVVDTVNKYKVGDLVIFCEIDSFIPHELAPFLSKGKEPKEYLGVRGERLRTVKLRGCISQGLLLPIGVINHMDGLEGWDVTEILNINKWEAPVNAQLAGMAKGNFPHWARKTNQQRCQNIKSYIQTWYENDVLWEVTIKLDGSSMSIGHNNGEIVVCSHNIELKLDQEGNAFVDAANKLNILDKLSKYGNIVISGELIGNGIQKNREHLQSHEFYVFDIFDVDEQKYIGCKDRLKIVEELGLHHVPILYKSITLKELDLDTIDKILEFAEGPSMNNNKREGLVFKLIDGCDSFKAVANSYILEK